MGSSLKLYSTIIAITLALLFSALNLHAQNNDTIPKNVDPIVEEPFPVPETIAEFPGGHQAMVDFVTKNVVYPALAKENGISGKVYVKFVVQKDGTLTDIKVLRGIGGGCDEEAIRVTKLMPKWTPAMLKGQPIISQYNLPFSFKLH